MLISRFDTDVRRRPRFAFWRMLTWLLLLLAAFGGVQYIHHAQLVWSALQSASPGETDQIAGLRSMLGWDVGYLVAAFVVIATCAGCIMRQAWARSVLRAVALVLCVWIVYGGVMLWHQWQGLESVPALASDVGRVFRINLALRAVSAPLLLWLAWQLGQPAVRLQFRSRPG
jgi:biotin transporter BioY